MQLQQANDSHEKSQQTGANGSTAIPELEASESVQPTARAKSFRGSSCFSRRLGLHQMGRSFLRQELVQQSRPYINAMKALQEKVRQLEAGKKEGKARIKGLLKESLDLRIELGEVRQLF